MPTESVKELLFSDKPGGTEGDAMLHQRQSPDSIVMPPEIISVRTRAMAATLIKERFLKLPPNITADERDLKRFQLREESIRQLFKLMGIIPINNQQTDTIFSEQYKAVEDAVPAMDKTHLVSLADTYEAHPAMEVINTVGAISNIHKDDLVYMRRVSLLLLEKYVDQQPQ